MPEFLTPDVLLTLGLLSGGFFVATLIAIPIILVRLPVDYFHEERPRTWLEEWPRTLRIAAYFLKNLIGLIFLAAGIAMLILPGQGILTILIGVSLMDFPGKRKMERSLIGQPTVLGAINKIRYKFGRPPLLMDGPL